MRRSYAILLSAALLAATPAIVVAQAAKPSPDAVEAGTYKVETHHTLAEFTVNHFGFSNFFGVIPGAAGTMTLNPKALASTKIDISLPVAQISTTNAVLDGELKSAEWFDAAQFPEIRFISTKVVRTGTDTARISGNVTIHGVTRPLVLDARFHGAGVNPMDKAYTVGFDATGVLKRSEFGVSKYVPAVSDDVQLKISAAFEKTN
ncbi:YceI family protein [Sphingobium yanoikuyae]|uniref:YceI family protein n=1 Tax=Sphingobium yanoikuyae TaxID=13690 RepID=UPI0022DD6E29|nr:YceI family protein [Sphingobium yanoikuyae]WBQ17613.1 YceI family protein [Sphingobium yanoikuyae]